MRQSLYFHTGIDTNICVDSVTILLSNVVIQNENVQENPATDLLYEARVNKLIGGRPT